MKDSKEQDDYGVFGKQRGCSMTQKKNLVHNFSEDMDFFMTYLNREGEMKVSQAIDAEWKRRIWKAHTDNKREKPLCDDGTVDKAAIYKQYGTTLLGLMITPAFLFAFQLGDGDILHISSTEIQPVIECDKILGTETHSLCKIDAWKKAITIIRKKKTDDEKPYLYLMSTDGFINSYRTQQDFHITCRDYYNLIQEHGFDAVSANLRTWLAETSEQGCGDDITVVMAYFSPAVESNQEETVK